MAFYPNDYGMMRMAEEHHRRVIRQKEHADADLEFVKLQLGRFSGWLGRRLVSFSERIRVQPDRQELPQS